MKDPTCPRCKKPILPKGTSGKPAAWCFCTTRIVAPVKTYDPDLDPLQKHRSRCKRWSDRRIDAKMISFSLEAMAVGLGKWKPTPLAVQVIYRAEQIRRYREQFRRETIRRHSMRKRPRLLRRPHWAGAPGY